jgi:hypothetical protein
LAARSGQSKRFNCVIVVGLERFGCEKWSIKEV